MTIKLKLELKWTKIKRVVTLPGDLNLADLHDVLQALFGFEHDHLWNFQDRSGHEYNTCCDPFGGPLNMDTRGKLDPYDYAIESVMPKRDDVLMYEYDYGDGWQIIVTRMADPKPDEIACIETAGTNAMEDIGGPPGLDGFTEALKACKLKGTDDDPDYDGDWRIQEWGYDDPEERRKFLAAPTLEELTKLLRNEISASRERTARRKEKAEHERLFKKVGRNDPCPCGSGKKFKKCCGK